MCSVESFERLYGKGGKYEQPFRSDEELQKMIKELMKGQKKRTTEKIVKMYGIKVVESHLK